MAFGISFGKNKSKGSSVTNVNKTETGVEATSGTKATTGTTTQTGTTTSQQQGTTSQTGTTTGTTTGSQTTQGTTQQFSDTTLAGLESAVGQLLGNIPTAPQQLEDNFDREAFIQGGVDAATSRVQGDLEASLNSMFDQFGGRDDSNSMAALLANRARGDAAANLAGVRASLIGQAEGIERENFMSNLAGTGQVQELLAQVLGNLKGGRATTTGATQTAEQTAGTQTQTGTSQQTGSEQTAQTTVQNLLELLNSITAGTQQTVGTESTKTKGKTSGGGIGLSL
jgi:hypothetical protein